MAGSEEVAETMWNWLELGGTGLAGYGWIWLGSEAGSIWLELVWLDLAGPSLDPTWISSVRVMITALVIDILTIR